MEPGLYRNVWRRTGEDGDPSLMLLLTYAVPSVDYGEFYSGVAMLDGRYATTGPRQTLFSSLNWERIDL